MVVCLLGRRKVIHSLLAHLLSLYLSFFPFPSLVWKYSLFSFKIKRTNYSSNPDWSLVKDYNQIVDNLQKKEFRVIDARPSLRYEGKVEEPRPALKKGHVPNAINIPFTELYDTSGEGGVTKLKNKQDLENLFEKRNLLSPSSLESFPIVSYCGSGVSASVVSLALHLIGFKNYSLVRFLSSLLFLFHQLAKNKKKSMMVLLQSMATLIPPPLKQFEQSSEKNRIKSCSSPSFPALKTFF